MSMRPRRAGRCPGAGLAGMCGPFDTSRPVPAPGSGGARAAGDVPVRVYARRPRLSNGAGGPSRQAGGRGQKLRRISFSPSSCTRSAAAAGASPMPASTADEVRRCRGTRPCLPDGSRTGSAPSSSVHMSFRHRSLCPPERRKERQKSRRRGQERRR
jgi:hypothetical protein